MTPDRRPLYMLLAAVCALLVGPAILGLIQHELVWLGLADAPKVSSEGLVMFELILVSAATTVMAAALYPERK